MSFLFDNWIIELYLLILIHPHHELSVNIIAKIIINPCQFKWLLFQQITDALATAEHVTSRCTASQSSRGASWLPGTCGRKGMRKQKRRQEVPRVGRKVRTKVSLSPNAGDFSFFNKPSQTTAFHSVLMLNWCIIHDILKVVFWSHWYLCSGWFIMGYLAAICFTLLINFV